MKHVLFLMTIVLSLLFSCLAFASSLDCDSAIGVEVVAPAPADVGSVDISAEAHSTHPSNEKCGRAEQHTLSIVGCDQDLHVLCSDEYQVMLWRSNSTAMARHVISYSKITFGLYSNRWTGKISHSLSLTTAI